MPLQVAPVGPTEPPNAQSSEEGLLGAILVNPDAIDRVRHIVEPDDFYVPEHADLFRVMCARRDAGEAIDVLLVAAAMGNRDLGRVPVRAYLAHLYAEATTVMNAPGYAKEIRNTAMKRKILAAAGASVEAISTGEVLDPSQHAAGLIEALDEVVQQGTADSLPRVSLSTASDLAIEAAIAAREGRIERGAPYGIPCLDRMTLGMRRGHLIVIAGRPGMGKTTFVLSVVLNASKARHGVYFVSLEMVAPELAERALSAECHAQNHRSRIAYSDIARGKDLSDDDLKEIAAARSRLGSWPLEIEQKAGLTISQIAARARRVKASMERQGIRLSVLVIDHLGLIKPSTRYSGNRVQEITEITGTAKVLAKDLDVAVVLLSQLSREVERNEDKRPQLANLRDSGSIEQDADVVIGLYREAYYLERIGNPTEEEIARLIAAQDVLEAEILKQRGAATGRVRLHCAIGANFVRELLE